MSKFKGIFRINRNKKVKLSLTAQISIVFVSIMAATLILSWLVNSLFLEKYYISNKRLTLFNVYRYMESECTNSLHADEYDLQLQKYSGTHNVSIVVISSLFEPIKIYASEPHEQLLIELRDNLMGNITADKVLMSSSDYVMIQKKDNRMQTDYIEMWGVLPDESFFLMRTAIESIKVSAGIANRFLFYIGLGAVTLSCIIIFFLSKKITKPILEITDISERVSRMDFDAKYTGNSTTEIGVLGLSINKMSDNLKRSIGELKAANEELQKDNEMKTRIDEMRKEFISNASHELKTPIALIQGYAEGLKEAVNETDERDYYCDVIIDESAKMNKMVKQLLALNQLESGADVIECEEFDIVYLVKNYLQSAEILTKQKGINVTYSGPEECLVNADEYKIEEVFSNYFSNAINHCESDKEKRIDVLIEKSENKVVVSVFNTCAGIPEESLEHLWEKFYKVDKARTREYGGSGVGLSIVKAIMEAHKGGYGVFNAKDGVCFWFSLSNK